MLSKMLPPDVVEKRSPYERRKVNADAKKTRETSGERASKNHDAASRLNTNWEKFRSVVGQQDSKQPKRQHSRTVKTFRTTRKAPRMVSPGAQSQAEREEKSDKDESKRSKELTKQIAIDCEMVGIGDGSESMIARVSLVNRHGVCVYDKYVKPREKIQDYRTAVSGIRPHHLTDGEDFKVVQSQVSEILRGKLLIGHALKNDLSVLFLSHPKRHLRDTSRYVPFRRVAMGNTPSLKKLAAELLGVEIQKGEHNSIEDARVAMQLYLLHKIQWEKDVYSRS